jgi:hypothetical protein
MEKVKINWAIILLLAALTLACHHFLQAQDINLMGLPLGSRNQLGIYSPFSTATGETILSQYSPQASFLNPAVLSFSDKFQLAASGRIMVARNGNSDNIDNTWHTYSRSTANPDFLGLTIRSGAWGIGLGYSLIEEYNRPEIHDYENFFRQNGRLHSFQLAVSHQVKDNFSLGFSINYRTGNLTHLDHYAYSEQENEYQADFKGFNLQFGLAWKVNKVLTLGLTIRPAYKMKMTFTLETRDLYFPQTTTSGPFTNYFRFPFALCLSSKVNISDNLNLYSDVSYWNWKQFSGGSRYDYLFDRFYQWPLESDFIKFSAGLGYTLKLDQNEDKTLHLLAGYIHDPYGPYTSECNIIDYLTCGLGLSIKNFGLENSVKFPLATVKHSWLIQASAFQLGFHLRL